MRAPAGIELLTDGTWDCGSTGGEWSPGGCGCSSGGSCGCGGSCGGCGVEGGCGGKPSTGEAPRLPDYDGEIWASPVRATIDRSSSDQATPCTPGFCYVGGVRRNGFLKPPNLVCQDEECLECETCQTTTATPVPWDPPPPPPPPPPPQAKPCPCMQEYQTAAMCIAFLGLASGNPAEYNAALERCEGYVRKYYECAAGHPECPTIALPHRMKVCGPDITDRMVDAIWNIIQEHNLHEAARRINRRWSPRGEPGEGAARASEALAHSLLEALSIKKVFSPGGGMFFKGGAFDIPGICPVDCPASKTFCGACYSDQVPGNIAFGLLGALWDSRAWAINYSNGVNMRDYGRPDPPDDVDNINTGADLLDEIQSGKIKDKDGLKKRLCEMLNAKVAAGKQAQMDCPTCSKKR